MLKKVSQAIPLPLITVTESDKILPLTSRRQHILIYRTPGLRTATELET